MPSQTELELERIKFAQNLAEEFRAKLDPKNITSLEVLKKKISSFQKQLELADVIARDHPVD